MQSPSDAAQCRNGSAPPDRADRPYDAWLVWILTERCNLNCRYCSNHLPAGTAAAPVTAPLPLPALDIDALIRTLDRTRKTFRIQFTGGGEPFLVPNLVAACVAISRRHYLGFNTNLTAVSIREFCAQVDPRRVSVIHASLHWPELERLGLRERYLEHFHLCRERGFPITAVAVGWPPLLPEVERCRTYFRGRGIEVSFSFFIGAHRGQSYPAAYTDEELRGFGLTRARVSIGQQQGELCNAGYNVGTVSAEGTVAPCGGLRESLGNIYRGFSFRKQLRRCPLPFCPCPQKIFDPFLFEKALAENPERGSPAGRRSPR